MLSAWGDRCKPSASALRCFWRPGLEQTALRCRPETICPRTCPDVNGEWPVHGWEEGALLEDALPVWSGWRLVPPTGLGRTPVLLCCLLPVRSWARALAPSLGLLVPARSVLGRRGEIMPVRGPARPQLSQGGGLDGPTSVVPLVGELPWGPGLTGVLSLSLGSGGAMGRSSFQRAGSR